MSTMKLILTQEVTGLGSSGDGGRLFGRVTTADVAAAVTAAGGPELDRRRIELPSSIKTTGQHQVTVRIHPEVASQLTIDVVAA